MSFRTNRRTRKPFRTEPDYPMTMTLEDRMYNERKRLGKSTDFEFSQWLEQRHLRQSKRHMTSEDEEFLKLTFDEWREGMIKRGLL